MLVLLDTNTITTTTITPTITSINTTVPNFALLSNMFLTSGRIQVWSVELSFWFCCLSAKSTVIKLYLKHYVKCNATEEEQKTGRRMISFVQLC